MVVKEIENFISLELFKKYVLLSTNYDNYKTNNNPTENALIHYSKDFMDNNYKKIQELSFTSDRKLMSNLYEFNNEYYLISKGGIDLLLNKCDYYETNKKYKLDSQIKKEILDKVNLYANEGRRIIGFAYKKTTKNIITSSDEVSMVFIGYVTLIDPPREETISAVNKCLSAGIKPVMLTGDYKNTAISIAKEIGIFKENDIALTGSELDDLSNKQLEEKIENISVFARLNPTQKIRIVDAWQSKNKVVAMTGDGVNDALALAKSDVSIAMGNGTEVAKDASSMILLDNNFNTIVKSISNGRKIFLNIQNSIRFLLSGNMAAIILVLVTSFLNLPIPFLAIHLLFINLLTDSFPAIAIGIQEYQNDLLNINPRNKKSNVLTKSLIIKTILEGFLLFVCCYMGYIDGLKINIETARTMAFSILCLSRLFHSLNCATKECFLIIKVKNKFMILSIVIGIMLINSVLFIPVLKDMFFISNLNIKLIFTLYSYSILPTLIIQIIKLFK